MQPDKFDGVDRLMLKLLLEDGRMPIAEIQRRVLYQLGVDYTPSGVKKRFDRLVEKCNLRILPSSLPTPEYKCALISLPISDSAEGERIASLYADCPRILFALEQFGRNNLLLGVLGTSLEALDEFLKKCPKSQGLHVKSEVSIAKRILLPKYLPVLCPDLPAACGTECRECSCRKMQKCAICCYGAPA